jgi:rhodanese-related sulfurtransferase
MPHPSARKWIWTAVAVFFFGGLGLPAAVETFRGRDRQEWKAFTPTITPQRAAEMVAQGKKVIFVDVREAQEHEEFRIPGSTHITLPDLHSADPEQFAGADAVIAYCLKDFRGWEGCKILAERGVKNVMILDGYGTGAWKKQGLPLAGQMPGKTDEQALVEIRQKFGGQEPSGDQP